MAIPRHEWRLVAVSLLLLLCAACEVDVRVRVDAERDGTGEVRAEVELDREALRQVPDLAEQLRVDDLRDAGWQVDGPVEQPGGGVVVRAVRPYSSAEEAEQALAQLSGPDGPFQDFELDVDRSFARTRTTLRGRVDLGAGIEGFSDADLQERLGGTPLGFDPKELEARTGSVFGDIFGVEVSARLPGRVSSNAPVEADNGAVWRPKLGESVTIEATAERLEVRNLALAATAGVSGVLCVLVAALQARRAVRRRRRLGRPAAPVAIPESDTPRP